MLSSFMKLGHGCNWKFTIIYSLFWLFTSCKKSNITKVMSFFHGASCLQMWILQLCTLIPLHMCMLPLRTSLHSINNCAFYNNARYLRLHVCILQLCNLHSVTQEHVTIAQATFLYTCAFHNGAHYIPSQLCIWTWCTLHSFTNVHVTIVQSTLLHKCACYDDAIYIPLQMCIVRWCALHSLTHVHFTIV